MRTIDVENATAGLMATVDVIREHGWTRSSFGTPDKGFCMLGAMGYVGTVAVADAIYALQQHIYAVYAGQASIAYVNDVILLSKEEAIALLLDAASSIQESGDLIVDDKKPFSPATAVMLNQVTAKAATKEVKAIAA